MLGVGGSPAWRWTGRGSRAAYATEIKLAELPHRTGHSVIPTARNKLVVQTGSDLNGYIQWTARPQTVLIVKKDDPALDATCVDIAEWLMHNFTGMRVLMEPEFARNIESPAVQTYDVAEEGDLARVVDFAICCGGDGTMLNVSRLFPTKAPPILAFAMGSFGFLTNFFIDDYAAQLGRMIEGGVHITHRSRLSCEVAHTDRGTIERSASNPALNEFVVHRGATPHLANLDIYLNGKLLTNCQADGIILSSPTGSTGYSLSDGGPIVHPSLKCIVMTPVAPRSLSFRPLALSQRTTVKVEVTANARAAVDLVGDGQFTTQLNRGDFITVTTSPFPLPCVSRTNATVDWMEDLTERLLWNKSWSERKLTDA